MSLASKNTECAKYGYLLQLARDQVKALESDDMFGFDRILSAKRVLIESLKDARSLIASDPILAKQVTQIQDLDKVAQRLLYRKMGRIMREMSEIQQYKKAHRAYGQNHTPSAPLSMTRFRPDESSYLDRRS